MADLRGPDRAAVGRLLVDSHRAGGAIVLTVYGEFDIESVREFERVIKAAEATAPRMIVIDLDGLSFTDSAGLRALILAHQRAGQGGYELVLRRVPDQARQVFELTGTTDYFTILD